MISIIVTTYKNIPLAERCVQSIVKSCGTTIAFEIILSDSVSTAKKTEALQRIKKNYSTVISQIITNEKNIGYPKAVNAGIEKAKGDIFLIMNSDILVEKDAIPVMVNHIQQHSTVGVLGPMLLNIDKSIMASAYRFYQWYTVLYRRTVLGRIPHAQKHLRSFLMQNWDHQDTRDVD